jgi:hypothetical protein
MIFLIMGWYGRETGRVPAAQFLTAASVTPIWTATSPYRIRPARINRASRFRS